jgi:hypothetical protein
MNNKIGKTLLLFPVIQLIILFITICIYFFLKSLLFINVFLTLAFLIIMPIVWYYYFVKNLKDIKKDPHFIYIIFVAVLEATPVLYMLLAFLIVIFFPN